MSSRPIPARVELAARRILAGRGDAADRWRATYYAGVAWGLRADAHRAAVEVVARATGRGEGRPDGTLTEEPGRGG